MSFTISPTLESEIDELISHYPQKRSASLMVLHALQKQFGYIGPEAVKWTAAKLGLQPIHIYELVTFYPMFGSAVWEVSCEDLPHFKPVRWAVHANCTSTSAQKLGLDSQAHGPQTTPDGNFTLELVECLAGCGTAPVMMVNDDFYESVSREKAEQILKDCR